MKTKYAQMKRDFDRMLQDLAKQSLKVKGQEFVLDAQIKIIKEQMQKLKGNESNHRQEFEKNKMELTLNNRDNYKQQVNLENECKMLNDGVFNAETTHFEHRLH